MAIVINFATTIKGNSTYDAHNEWILNDSMQFGVGRSISAMAGGKSREMSTPSFSEMTFSRSTDISSPELYYQAVQGQSLGKCEVHLLQTVNENVQVYLIIELEAAIISSYSASSGGDRPSESFSINFHKISFQYDDFDGETKITGTPKKWDVMASKPY